jgi:peptide deformylase
MSPDKTEIVDKNAPVLRATASEVAIADIGSKKIQDILKRMIKALLSQDDGVAIAAPQIGESLRIFIVGGNVFTLMNKDHDPDATSHIPDPLVFINPVITKLSKSKKKMEEGCLSVRWLYGLVERSEKATITAYDETGKKFTKGASGLLAQIFQHEVDHLNGILFIDKAENVEDIPPQKHANG